MMFASPVVQQSSVAVVRCPTTYHPAQAPPQLPKRTSVDASPAATSGLDAYSNGILTTLAPAGWSCHATLAADGTATIVIAPTATAHPAQPAITEQFAGTAATAAALACPLFPAAAAQLPRGARCAHRRPARETTTRLSGHALSFRDPPQVRGDGQPSGGSDPARGLAVFVASGASFAGYAFTATCTLPASRAGVCNTVLADAITRIPVEE
jgi:hypothetical protein